MTGLERSAQGPYSTAARRPTISHSASSRSSPISAQATLVIRSGCCAAIAAGFSCSSSWHGASRSSQSEMYRFPVVAARAHTDPQRPRPVQTGQKMQQASHGKSQTVSECQACFRNSPVKRGPRSPCSQSSSTPSAPPAPNRRDVSEAGAWTLRANSLSRSHACGSGNARLAPGQDSGTSPLTATITPQRSQPGSPCRASPTPSVSDEPPDQVTCKLAPILAAAQPANGKNRTDDAIWPNSSGRCSNWRA